MNNKLNKFCIASRATRALCVVCSTCLEIAVYKSIQKNLNVKTNSRNVILLNYKLRQYIKGKTCTHIKLSISTDH
jgi:hypothetical protein